MNEDSPFKNFKDNNADDRRIGLRDIKIFFCHHCGHVWKAGSAEICFLCKGPEIREIYKYRNLLPRT